VSAYTHKTLRRWAFAAGYIEQELDAAAQRMHNAIRNEVLRKAAAEQRNALVEDPGLSEAALIDLIDPDKEN
jgi:hypothetical protein